MSVIDGPNIAGAKAPIASKPQKSNTKERQLKISSNLPNVIYQNLKPAKCRILKKIVVLETLHNLRVDTI